MSCLYDGSKLMKRARFLRLIIDRGCCGDMRRAAAGAVWAKRSWLSIHEERAYCLRIIFSTNHDLHRRCGEAVPSKNDIALRSRLRIVSLDAGDSQAKHMLDVEAGNTCGTWLAVSGTFTR